MALILYNTKEPDVIPSYPESIDVEDVVDDENMTTAEKIMAKETWLYNFKEAKSQDAYILNERSMFSAIFRSKLNEKVKRP